MSFMDLPHEIIVVILRRAIDGTAFPSNVLCVCKLFRDVGTDHLYTHLKFTSANQLHQFALSDGPQPPIAPRSLAVDLTGKAQPDVLHHLCDALMKCRQLGGATEGTLHGGRDTSLKHIRLRMHSYSRDVSVDVLEQGLGAISPDTFEWTGPDPDHHFSTAIVPQVASCIFKRFPSWRNVREIVVTNISFGTGIGTDPTGRFPPLMDDVPSLRYLYIGQATFLHAQAVAGMFLKMANLEVIRLVDAYSESIWGPRLRRSDVEKAAMTLCCPEEQIATIARVRRVVACEKKTERIMGGDRVDGTHILD